MLPVPREDQKPSPIEFGCTLTIGIAAITGDRRFIVTASDRMLSSSDGVVPATEDSLKARQIAKSWALMFAAEDANIFLPVVRQVWEELIPTPEAEKKSYDLDEVQAVVADVYRNTFDATFTSKYLVRYGYKNIADFKATGFAQFGDQKFREICDAIDNFDLGLSLMAYGFDGKKKPHIFQVENPATITDHNLLGYAVIGSGFYMATASLRRKKMPHFLNPMIYRVLEAKFSAETAPGVGKDTILFWMTGDGKSRSMGYVACTRFG